MSIMQKMSEMLMPAVDRVPEGVEWSYSLGFVSEDMVQEHLFPYEVSTIAVMCGPPPMIKYVALPSQRQTCLCCIPDQKALERGVMLGLWVCTCGVMLKVLMAKRMCLKGCQPHRVLDSAEPMLLQSAAEGIHPG